MSRVQNSSETIPLAYIHQRIRDFAQNSSCWELKFPSTLTKEARKYVHEYISRMSGYWSRSFGVGDTRRITVFKRNLSRPREPHNPQVPAINQWFTLTPKSKDLLRRWYSCIVLETAFPDPGNTRPVRNGPERNACSSGLLNFAGISSAFIPSEPHASQDTAAERMKLPIAEYRQEILDVIEEKQIVIINGDTGSGKTTQVPQYILENAHEKKIPCRIICTQPRRMAAVTIAERVANERGERLGTTVGYQIRLQSRLNKKTNLIYTTSGCVLRSLMNNVQGTFDGITHIIIDEIHERDKNTDFILIALRDELQRRGIKAILMSATMDTNLLCDYFHNVPIINVPGRCYEIKNFYLEDILYQTNFKKMLLPGNVEFYQMNEQQNIADELIDVCLIDVNNDGHIVRLWKSILNQGVSINVAQTTTLTTPLHVAIVLNNLTYVEKFLRNGADKYMTDRFNLNAFDYAEKHENKQCLEMLQKHARDHKDDPEQEQQRLDKMRRLRAYEIGSDDDEIDHNLLITLIQLIFAQGTPGSILVFLPGYNDIILQKELITEKLPANSFRLFLLHSNMRIEDQQQVMEYSQMRKIILSTNIGETSITFPDVAYVIDSGKVKLNSYDSVTSTSYLKSTWISKACAEQRAGRAGRTQIGTCYRMYSRKKYESMNNFAIPEFLRIPLTEICLYAKAISRSSLISNYLSKALEPPENVSIRTAVQKLKMIGALDDAENMTELGQHLVEMPLEVQLGKCLLFSILLKCLDPVLTIVAFHSVKDPFLLPTERDERLRASAKRKQFSANSCSDHIGIVNMYREWISARNQGSFSERRFLSENYLAKSSLEMMHATRKQILDHVKRTYNAEESLVDVNNNARNLQFVQMCLVAGLYPNIGFLERSRGKVTSAMETTMMIHVGSALRPTGGNDVRQSISQLPHDWIAFYEKTTCLRQTTSIRHNTLVPLVIVAITLPSPNMLEVANQMPNGNVAGGYCVGNGESKLIIDNWIQFLATEEDRILVSHLKSNFNKAIKEFLLHGRIIHKQNCDVLIENIKAVLKNELRGGQVNSGGAHAVMQNIGHFRSLNLN